MKFSSLLGRLRRRRDLRELDAYFQPMYNDDGEVIGVMDQMTADFLASTDPDPTQASLDAGFAGLTRVRMLGMRQDDRYLHFDVPLLDITDPADIADLAAALRIQEADQYGHCMCLGDHRLEMWADDRLVHTLGLHHWSGIRWESAWKGDANLADPLRFEEWLLAHGITGARDDRLENERRVTESTRAQEMWERAMPLSLRHLWPDQLDDCRADVGEARARLEGAVPDPVDRVCALYTWFGSGEGPWSGYPSYEGMPETLLLAYAIDVLVAALERSTDNPVTVLGAARLFGGSDFGKSRGDDRAQCPAQLRLAMLDAVVQQGNSDNLERFRYAFGR